MSVIIIKRRLWGSIANELPHGTDLAHQINDVKFSHALVYAICM